MFTIEIIGNLGKDATTVNHNGNSFISMTVAATNVSKDISGNKIENTTWVNVTTQPNEKLQQFLTKGTSVYVRGLAKLRIYQSINGPAIDVSCRASELKLLSSTHNDIKTVSNQNQNQDQTGLPF